VVLILLGSGRHFDYIEYILPNNVVNQTEVVDFAAHILYTTALLICRLSGLAFYSRICDRHGELTWAVRGAAVFMITSYIPQLLLIIFHCRPVTGLWPYSFQSEAQALKCLPWGVVYVTNSTISMCCDIILIAIPAAIIHALNVGLKDKMKLICVLMPGLLVIAISAVRMYLVIVGQWTADESWTYDPFLAVEVSEIGSTMIALSIPALKPFVGSVFAFLDRTFVSGQEEPGLRPPHLTFGTSMRRSPDTNGDVPNRDLNHWTGMTFPKSIAIAIRTPETRSRTLDRSSQGHIEAASQRPPWVERIARVYHPQTTTTTSSLDASGINWRQDMVVTYETALPNPG
jgi:hypothetical protein